MTINSQSKEFDSRQSATPYQLCVRGNIPENWESRLGCFRVVSNEESELDSGTTLVGSVMDQSELIGILNTLHELRVCLLSVEQLDSDSLLNFSANKESINQTKST